MPLLSTNEEELNRIIITDERRLEHCLVAIFIRQSILDSLKRSLSHALTPQRVLRVMVVMKVMKMISKTRELKSLLRKGPRGCHLDKKKKSSRACFEFRVLVVRRKKKVCVLSEAKTVVRIQHTFVSFQSRKRFRKL